MTDTDKQTVADVGDEALPEQYEYVEEVVEYKDTRRIRTLLAVVLALLALLLAFFGYRVYTAQQGRGGASQAQTEGMVWLRSIYGWGDTQDEQLIAPHTVAVGPDGLIWTNSNNRAAVAFNPDGSFDRILQSNPDTSGESSETAGSGAAATVDAVFSLDVDTKNNLYICDNANSNILQFSPEAALKQGWSVPSVNAIAANDARVVALTQGPLVPSTPRRGTHTSSSVRAARARCSSTARSTLISTPTTTCM